MKIFQFAILISALGPGCGTSSEQSVEDGGPVRVRVTIRTGVPPFAMVFREESSPQWQAIASPGVSTYEVVASGPYRVAIACHPVDGDMAVQEYARARDDDPVIEHACRSYPFTAAGEVGRPGMVALGGWRQASLASPWRFELPTATGSFDLVMLSGDFRSRFDAIAIRRGVTVGGNTDLGSFGFTQDVFHPLVETTLSPTNFEPGEVTFSDTRLHAGETFAAIDDSFIENDPAWHPLLAPDSVLQDGDRQVVTLAARMSSSRGSVLETRLRTVQRDARTGDGVRTSVTLPPPLETVRFELSAARLVASWTSLPEHDELTIHRASFSPDGSRAVFHDAALSAAYVEEVGTTSAVLDVGTIPGLPSDWYHDPSFRQVVAMFADHERSDRDRVSSGLLQAISAGPPPLLAGADRADRVEGNVERSGRRVLHPALDNARAAPWGSPDTP